MPVRLKFRYRINALLLLAAAALIVVTLVTLVQGRRNERELSGIETRYVPLIELDRDLKRTVAQLTKELEDAAGAADEARLQDAARSSAEIVRLIASGATTIRGNGGDPVALEAAFRSYEGAARAVSTALATGTAAARLVDEIDAMRRAQQRFTAQLDLATSPDRTRLAAAFAAARESQAESLKIDVIVAAVAIAMMALVSLWIIRRTVRSLRAVSAGVKRLAQGEFGEEIDVDSGDELGDLAREANRTAIRLREYREQAEREVWVESGLAGLMQQIAGELDRATLASQAVGYLGGYVDATSGSLYVREPDGRFHRVEATDVAKVAPVPAGFVLGDELVNEIAAGKQLRVVDGVTVLPLTHEDHLLGVLVLVLRAAQAPSARTTDLLDRVRTTLGVALHVAESRERARSLLIETQRQAHAAELANKELEAFGYSVSHDLRAPLRAIDAFSQAIVEDEAARLSATGQGHFARIRAATQRMGELIDDLLSLSRVSGTELRKDRIDLSPIVAAIVADLRKRDPARVVDVVIAERVMAIADLRMMRITLENLLGNAWKFTSKTTAARIEFGACTVHGREGYFVRDNGAGFDMKHAERLFGAFQRLHSETEFPGTGIGLATVQRIILRHEGEIWAESSPGHGATFTFTLKSA